MILAEYFPATTSSMLADFVFCLFILSLLGFMAYGFFNENVKPLKLKDCNNFDIGYIRDQPAQVVAPATPLDELEELKRKVQMAKLKRELEELERPTFNSALFNDCVDVLVGLGTPKRKAQAEARNIFEKYPDIKDHNEFIERYGKK